VRSGGRQATGDALSRAAERVGSLCSVAGHDEVRLMAKRGFGRWLARLSLCASCAAGAGVFSDDRAIAQASDHPDVSIELVDPKTLRVCADPHNLPFSTDKGEGFENKIAELLSAQLGKDLAYAWYPQAPGFVRNTLGAHQCDLIMGMPQGDDLVQVTN